jgi:hypothetical protein
MHDPEEALLRLLEGLDRLDMPYMVGGTAASSVHGVWRATNDIDSVVLLTSERIDDFIEEFAADFYVDKDQILQALRFRRAFNIIHLTSAYKFDIFPLTDDRFQQQQFARRRYENAAVFGGQSIEIAVATPEDVILSKLVWYKKGGQVSDQQWNDILGVVTMQQQSLDRAYMQEWARHLSVEDLLEAALTERHGN